MAGRLCLYSFLFYSGGKILDIIRIPLHHLPAPIQILRVIIRAANTILIHMCKLHRKHAVHSLC